MSCDKRLSHDSGFEDRNVSALYTKFGSHLTENKLRVHCKDQSVNWNWLCESHVTHIYTVETLHKPILVAVRSKAWICGHSLDGIVGSNPTGRMVV